MHKCPYCGRDLELVPDANDPARDMFLCVRCRAGWTAADMEDEDPAKPEPDNLSADYDWSRHERSQMYGASGM